METVSRRNCGGRVGHAADPTSWSLVDEAEGTDDPHPHALDPDSLEAVGRDLDLPADVPERPDIELAGRVWHHQVGAFDSDHVDIRPLARDEVAGQCPSDPHLV